MFERNVSNVLHLCYKPYFNSVHSCTGSAGYNKKGGYIPVE